MHKVIVTKRNDSYHAALESNPRIWGTGSTAAEAVGDLVIFHPDSTQIFVKRDPGQKTEQE
jgi:hypothetical protein